MNFSTYQVVFAGGSQPLTTNIAQGLRKAMDDLGIRQVMLRILNAGNWTTWESTSPTVAVYSGTGQRPFPDLHILADLQTISAFVVPEVNNLINVPLLLPPQLSAINAIELNAASVPALVNVILEAFGLLRITRRLFISYRRVESTAVAMQLYEELDRNGFNVFLDTQSVKPGKDFQEELWHSLADTDVILMIDTPQFRESRWTTEELAKASSMSIGILQIIWPRHRPAGGDIFAYTLRLRWRHFNLFWVSRKATLRRRWLDHIVIMAESLRARNLAARQKLLVRNFMENAQAAGRSVALRTERYILYNTGSGHFFAIIPTVGVPDAFHLHTREQFIRGLQNLSVSTVYILYDNTNIRKEWLVYLSWLNQHLPVQTISINETAQWILNN